jgi:D-hexose-6-phosphate mutarotase
MNDIDELQTLNERYAIPFKLCFKNTQDSSADHLVVAEVSNAFSKASICLQGAQVLSWQPATTEQPVIWMSPDAKYAPNIAIRGGVPICWPWFGAHAENDKLPAHGFARTQAWQVKGTRSLDDGSTELSLTLPINASLHKIWPHQAQLDMLVNVGRNLKIAIVTRNLGNTDFKITEALHTYFQVSDIAQVEVEGLDGVHFHDKAAGWTQGDQMGPVGFTGEVDRVYVNNTGRCAIVDTTLKRRINIAKIGSQSTIVWNPGAARASQMGDLGAEGWRQFVCVESGNALENAVTVPAGKSHTLAVEYQIEALAI